MVIGASLLRAAPPWPPKPLAPPGAPVSGGHGATAPRSHHHDHTHIIGQNPAYGYTRLFGYHPILATRADTREALHIRLRRGSANTQKRMLRFCEELIARVQRAGATAVKLLRADSGFWNTKVFERLERTGWQYSIGVRMIKTVRAAVEAIDETAWQTIADYPDDGEAQIAETVYGGRRLIVRRTRLLGAQAELWPDWRHFAFLTNRTDDLPV